ncbi:MAG: hypothetical protein AAFQ84_10150 [Pseudomonadota bacterium]
MTYQSILDQAAPALVQIGFFVAAFVLSTVVIRLGIPKLRTGTLETKAAPAPSTSDMLTALVAEGRLPESSKAGRIFDIRSTGFWIGFCETLLIFVLVSAEAFNALAIIIGAKQFVRNEQIRLIPSYYLLGTLANLCIAVLFAILAQHAVEFLPAR